MQVLAGRSTQASSVPVLNTNRFSRLLPSPRDPTLATKAPAEHAGTHGLSWLSVFALAAPCSRKFLFPLSADSQMLPSPGDPLLPPYLNGSPYTFPRSPSAYSPRPIPLTLLKFFIASRVLTNCQRAVECTYLLLFIIIFYYVSHLWLALPLQAPLRGHSSLPYHSLVGPSGTYQALHKYLLSESIYGVSTDTNVYCVLRLPNTEAVWCNPRHHVQGPSCLCLFARCMMSGKRLYFLDFLNYFLLIPEDACEDKEVTTMKAPFKHPV